MASREIDNGGWRLSLLIQFQPTRMHLRRTVRSDPRGSFLLFANNTASKSENHRYYARDLEIARLTDQDWIARAIARSNAAISTGLVR